VRDDGGVLDDVVEVLCCPVCSARLAVGGRTLSCAAGHSFDVARQGYANLLTGDAGSRTADTAEMVAARVGFLAAGHYEPIATRLAAIAAETPGVVVDAGAGTGYYLARVLDAVPDQAGVAMDISKYALRRAARAHPRVGAVVCDVWRALPVRTGAAAVVLNVFAPRNGAEFRRILRPGGALIVVTPTSRHLGELVGELGLLSVDPRKDERTAETLGEFFTEAATEEVEFSMRLGSAEVATLVAMGPNARHTDPIELAERIEALPRPQVVTGAVRVTTFLGR
jgi:23S rRNA (guanine745-N1)-methyltransferase